MKILGLKQKIFWIYRTYPFKKLPKDIMKIITYTPQKPDKEVIQKQEILVTPNIATGDKVNNIIIESVKSDRNGFLEKKMLWQLDHSFLITTTTQKPGEPEIVTTTRVTWNDHSQE